MRRAFLVLLLSAAVFAQPFVQTWHRPPRPRTTPPPLKRQQVLWDWREYCVSDNRTWTAADLVGAAQRLAANGTCSLLATTQIHGRTLFVIECRVPPANAHDALGVSAAIAPGLVLEPNHVMFAVGVAAAGTQASAPWHLDRLDSLTPTYDGQYRYLTDGAGCAVPIYIIDTGIYAAHQEFAPGSRATGVQNTIDNTGTADCHGHGTHVSSLAIGATYGVLKRGCVRMIKALDCAGSGTVYTVASAIAYVQAVCGSTPIALSMSLTGPGSSIVDDAVSHVQQACHVSVAVAAGNAADNACFYSPARVASCLTVGATRPDDAPAYYTNTGSCVDLFAPGGDGGDNPIVGAGITSPTSPAAMSGTSMATPLTAATASMFMAERLASGYVLGNENLGLVVNHDVLAHLSNGYVLYNYVNDSMPSVPPPAPPPPPILPPPPAPPPDGFDALSGDGNVRLFDVMGLVLGLVLLIL